LCVSLHQDIQLSRGLDWECTSQSRPLAGRRLPGPTMPRLPGQLWGQLIPSCTLCGAEWEGTTPNSLLGPGYKCGSGPLDFFGLSSHSEQILRGSLTLPRGSDSRGRKASSLQPGGRLHPLRACATDAVSDGWASRHAVGRGANRNSRAALLNVSLESLPEDCRTPVVMQSTPSKLFIRS
jgi:hypothetical protein